MHDQQNLGRLFDAALKQVDVSVMPSPSGPRETVRETYPQATYGRQIQMPAAAPTWPQPTLQPARSTYLPQAPAPLQIAPTFPAASAFPAAPAPAFPAAPAQVFAAAPAPFSAPVQQQAPAAAPAPAPAYVPAQAYAAPATAPAFATAPVSDFAPYQAAPVQAAALAPAEAPTFAAAPAPAVIPAPAAVPAHPAAPASLLAEERPPVFSTAYAPSTPIVLEDAPRQAVVEETRRAPAPARTPWKFVRPGEPEIEEEAEVEAAPEAKTENAEHDFNEEFRIIMEEKIAKRRRARRRSIAFTLLFFSSTAAGATGWVASNPDRLQAFKTAMSDIRSAGDIKGMVAKYEKALQKIAVRGKQIDDATVAIGADPKSVSSKDDLYFNKEMKDMMGSNGGPTVGERNGKFEEKFAAVKDKGLMAAAMGISLKEEAADGLKRHKAGERNVELPMK